jgi:hypothetical protein
LLKNQLSSRAVVVHAFDPSTWVAEAGGFLSSRPAWSTELVPGQPGLHRETLSRKTKRNEKKKKNQKPKKKKKTQLSNFIAQCPKHPAISDRPAQTGHHGSTLKEKQMLSHSGLWSS